VLADERHAVRAQQRVRLDQIDDLGDRQPRRHRVVDAPAVERMRAGGNAQQRVLGLCTTSCLDDNPRGSNHNPRIMRNEIKWYRLALGIRIAPLSVS
jgi:hypothetical protein